LGSDATDRLVHLVQEVQHSVASKAEDTTLCGAKITGGGSGGTVCVIGRNCLKSGEQNIEFDLRSLPPVAPLPTPSDSREHSAVFVVERELKLLNFQLNNSANPSLGNNSSLSETGRSKGDFFEPLLVKQGKKHISTPVPHDSYSVLFVSSSGKYVTIVWPDILYFSVYMPSDWSIVDFGTARLLAWDTCRDRFSILE
ncbi:hypothetical protein S83_070158, partial [Arachis hypogaea]